MEDLKKEQTKHKKHNIKRTKQAQLIDDENQEVKRRVNITVNGNVWDKLDEAGIKNKSAEIEKMLEQLLEQKGISY